MAGVSIEITGGAELVERLEELDERIASSDPRELFTSIENEWVTAFQGFIRDQGVGGESYAPLAPSTRRDRAREGVGQDGPILQRQSDLINSIRVLELGADTLAVGTRMPKAALLNFGGQTSPFSRIPNALVPARPFVVLTPELLDDTMAMVRAFYFGDEVAT